MPFAGAVARENTLLLRIDRAVFEALYLAESVTAVRVQQAIQRTLLQSMRHTNKLLARLIGLARIRGRRESGGMSARELEAALYGQFCLLRR